MKKFVIVPGIVAVACLVIWLALPTTEQIAFVERGSKAATYENSNAVKFGLAQKSTDSVEVSETIVETSKENDKPSESITEDEKSEAEREKRVEDFGNLTDKWMEPSSKGVTMADVDKFAKTFRQVPKNRQDECIHREMKT